MLTLPSLYYLVTQEHPLFCIGFKLSEKRDDPGCGHARLYQLLQRRNHPHSEHVDFTLTTSLPASRKFATSSSFPSVQ